MEDERKETRGRPMKYRSAKDMQAAVDAYFMRIAKNQEPATITGLAIHLGFSTRHGLLLYGHREAFAETVEFAKLRVEHEYEKRLLADKNAAGAIFGLKNFGWTDAQRVEHTGDGGGPLTIAITFVEPQPAETSED